MKNLAVILGVIGLALSFCQTARADDRNTPLLDESFAREAAQGGLAEVKLGQLAVDQGTNPEVRKFGQRMVDDHSKANQELMTILEKKGIAAPGMLDREHQNMLEGLSRTTGSNFDRMYISHMVKDHEQDVQLFEKEATKGQDPDIRTFAEKTLPIIKEHLQMAKDLMSAGNRGR
jgi:putative membrane protein